jgi:hypothetical protein
VVADLSPLAFVDSAGPSALIAARPDRGLLVIWPGAADRARRPAARIVACLGRSRFVSFRPGYVMAWTAIAASGCS